MDDAIVFRFDGFVLDPARATLERNGEPIALRPKTYALLAHLVEHRHRVVSREELLQAVWPGRRIEPQGVFQSVSEIRAAFAFRDPIRTVRGRGYQWVAPTSLVDRANPPPDAPGARKKPWRMAAAIAIALGALMLLAGRGSGLYQDRLPSVDHQLEQAREYLSAGSLHLAESQLAGLLRINPDHLAARLDLAYVYMQQGRRPRSIDLAQEVHQAAIAHGTPFEQMASALLISQLEALDSKAGTGSEYAREAAAIAHRLQLPAYGGLAHEQLGEISLRQGRRELAVNHLSRALELLEGVCPDAEARVQGRLTTLIQRT